MIELQETSGFNADTGTILLDSNSEHNTTNNTIPSPTPQSVSPNPPSEGMHTTGIFAGIGGGAIIVVLAGIAIWYKCTHSNEETEPLTSREREEIEERRYRHEYWKYQEFERNKGF